jgi:hypothetical protein
MMVRVWEYYMLKAILGFLFGKQANIFNKEGRVVHNLGQNKWTQWNHRLSENPNYNWRKHSGTQPKDTNKSNPL